MLQRGMSKDQMTEEKIKLRNNELGHWISGYIGYPDVSGEYPAVIFVHGYRSSKETSKSKTLIEKLPEKNMVFITIDLSGCGESDGEFADSTITKYISDVKAAINFAATLPHVNANRIALIGSSLGGMVAIHSAVNDPRVKAAVLISPVSDFKNLEMFKNRETMEMWRIEGMQETSNSRGEKFTIKYGFYQDGITHDTYSAANQLNFPVLVIHGNKDESVPIGQSKELMKHLKQGSVEVVDGADHRYTQLSNFTKMIGLTMHFLEDKIR
jgi:dipeptidyl aminopeptidase/acylaminoacyl peptidase